MSDKLKIYCETSFWSYLTGRQSADEKIARCQAFTLKWWQDIAPQSKGGIWPMKYEWEKMSPLEEVYAIRKRIAEKFGYSLDAIFDAGIKEQREAESRGEVLNFVKLPIARPSFT